MIRKKRDDSLSLEVAIFAAKQALDNIVITDEDESFIQRIAELVRENATLRNSISHMQQQREICKEQLNQANSTGEACDIFDRFFKELD